MTAEDPCLRGLHNYINSVESQNQVIVQSADVMGGMMKALTATGAGLFVAIPCHAAFNLLVVKIDRIVLDMETAASELIAFIKSGMKEEKQ